MSSATLDGRGCKLFITANGKRYVLIVEDFDDDVDFDLKMEDFSGEKTARAKPQFNGHNLTISCSEDDPVALELAQVLIDAELAGVAAPVCNIKALYAYRKAGVGRRLVNYPEVTLAPGKRGWQGRKDNVKSGFKGFAETRQIITA